MLALRIYRPFLFALLAVCGLGLNSNRSLAGNCTTCQQACVDCPPNACECACDCASPKRTNYVYKALDKVAGGIEKLLGLDKLNCDSCCDEGSCDGCCDATTLKSMPIPNTPIYSTPVDNTPIYNTPLPSTPIYSTPVDRAPVHRQQTPPASIVPYLDSDHSKTPGDHSHPPADSQHSQDHQWLGQPPSPNNELRMSEPAAIEPEVIEPEMIAPEVIPQALEPRVIDPPIHQQEPLTNPFKDDAKVTKRQIVRPVVHNQSPTRSDQNTSQDKDPKWRQSEGYPLPKRAVRTLR